MALCIKLVPGQVISTEKPEDYSHDRDVVK